MAPTIPDKSRFFAMGKYARENKVDQIIQIGDFASVDSLNRFDGNDTLKGKKKPSFGEDMKSFQQAIRAFNKGLDGYDIPKHVTLGNHEDRIWSFTNKNPEIVDMLDEYCLPQWMITIGHIHHMESFIYRRRWVYAFTNKHHGEGIRWNAVRKLNS